MSQEVLILTKLRRYLKPGAAFFVTSVVKDREKIFLSDKTCYGNKYNKMQGRTGQVWQSMFYDEGIIGGMEKLIQKVKYIHDNPVRAGIAAEPGEYEYSSYNYYNGNVKNYIIDLPE